MAVKRVSLDRGYWVFLLPGAIALLLVIIIPFMVNVGISFTQWNGITSPTWIGLDNYEKAAHDKTFLDVVPEQPVHHRRHDVIPTIIGLFLAAFLYDYVANKIGNRAASIFRAGYYLPQILPVAIAGVVWRWILQPRWGVLNWLLAQVGMEPRNWLGDADLAIYSVMGIMVWFQIGYPLVIFMAALQRVDPELYEAASVDGANWLEKFVHITIHQIRPEIFVVVLMTLIHSLKIFAQIFVLTRGGPGRATIVPSYFAYQNFFEKANVGYGATIATILTVIIILLTVLFINVQSRQELREAV